MIWLWAWPAIGFLTGVYLIFSPAGGGRRITLSLGDWLDGWATDLGWLILFTFMGPITALWVAAIYGFGIIQNLRGR